MTNKKALDILFSGPVGYTLNEYNEASNVIYKSLERLETLNNVWHKNEPMESVDINANNLQELYDFNNKLIQENEKLKKALELLKDKLEIEIVEKLEVPFDPFNEIKHHLKTDIWVRKLAQQEYEELKEVLGND